MRAALYVRISKDSAKKGLGVTRQENLCRARADELGWTVTQVYSDNDVSATKATPRPAYQQMLADLTDGSVEAVIVYAIDRLTRRPMELEHFINLVEAKGVALANVAGDVRLDTIDGRNMARIMGSLARREAETIGKRVSDEKAQRAGMGIPHKGRHRLYGYTGRVKQPAGTYVGTDWEVIPTEAAIIKEAFVRRAKGESLTAIANDFTKRGIKTVSGNDWKSGTLSDTLKKVVYKGRVSYKGEEVADSKYPALIDAATFDLAQANMANDSKGTNARRYLLSGILVCRKCLTQMKGNPSNHMYRCAKNYGGCGKLSVRIKIADDWALSLAMNKHHEKPAQAVESHRDYTAEVEALNAEIGRLRELATAGAMSMPEAVTQIRERQATVAKLEKEAQKVLPRTTRATRSYLDYHKMNLSQRRVFITDHIANIVVGPSISRGNQPFNPARLEVHYTDGTVEIPTQDMALGD